MLAATGGSKAEEAAAQDAVSYQEVLKCYDQDQYYTLECFVQDIVGKRIPLDSRDHCDRTPLHIACGCWEGRTEPEKFRPLLEAGAPLDATDCFGRTPLHLACGYADFEDRELRLAHMLAVEWGAPLLSEDEDGHTPLCFALADGRDATARILKEEAARRGALWRAEKLKWRCWAVAVREDLDVGEFIPPLIIAQSRAWAARHPWVRLEPHFDFGL